jgi:hypothetical protein
VWRAEATQDTIVTRADLPRGTWIAGAATLLTASGGRPVLVQESFFETRDITWYASPTGHELPLPPLDASELAGPGCAAATHYVSSVVFGAYRAVAQSAAGGWEKDPLDASACQPGGCAEAVAIALTPVGHVGCAIGAPGCPWPPPRSDTPSSFRDANHSPPRDVRGGCPSPLAGQMTEQAAQATRLFQGQQWFDAFLGLARVARGETGDDEANKQLATFRAAVAALEIGEWSVARDFMVTSNVACHLGVAEAAAWLDAVRRRAATRP